MLPSPTREKLPKDTLPCFVVKLKSFSQTFLCTIKQNLLVRENISAKYFVMIKGESLV